MSEKQPIPPELAAEVSARHAGTEKDLAKLEESINSQQVAYGPDSRGYTRFAEGVGYENNPDGPVRAPEDQMNPLAVSGSALSAEVGKARERNLIGAKLHLEANEGAYRTAATKEALEDGKLVSTPEALELATETLASQFHEAWREARKQEDGSFEPRIKETKDQEWAEAHGTNEVDIANTAFAELPSDWQKENADAAGVVVELIDSYDGEINLSDADTRERVGSAIHDAWLERNDWAKGGELDATFAELPKEEQDKDIAQMETALELFQ